MQSVRFESLGNTPKWHEMKPAEIQEAFAGSMDNVFCPTMKVHGCHSQDFHLNLRAIPSSFQSSFKKIYKGNAHYSLRIWFKVECEAKSFAEKCLPMVRDGYGRRNATPYIQNHVREVCGCLIGMRPEQATTRFSVPTYINISSPSARCSVPINSRSKSLYFVDSLHGLVTDAKWISCTEACSTTPHSFSLRINNKYVRKNRLLENTLSAAQSARANALFMSAVRIF